MYLLPQKVSKNFYQGHHGSILLALFKKYKMRTILSFLFIVFSISLYAQDKSSYELLWEIKHKQIDKKSYLFGTAHLRDARVFEFSDQVLPALLAAESFALEVHPDSSIAAFLENKRSLSRPNLEEILDEDDLEKVNFKLKEILSDSTMLSLKDINIDDLKSKLKPNLSKETDRETFLDAYLYGLARSNEKNIYGLENIEDQSGIGTLKRTNKDDVESFNYLMEEDFELNYEDQINQLVELYQSGNAVKIYKFYVENGNTNLNLDARNTKMTASMDAIMQNESLFAAVGAAHLMGKYGIVNLLRLKGYDVRPVIATFNDDRDSLAQVDGLKYWENVENSTSGFNLLRPVNMQYENKKTLENLTISFDLISGVSIFYSAIDANLGNTNSQESHVKNLFKRFERALTDYTIKETPLENGGIMHLITGSKENNQTEIKIIEQYGMVYVFGVEFNNHPNSIRAKEYYFKNIQLYPPDASNFKWTALTNKEAAYTIMYPNEYKDLDQQILDPTNPAIGYYDIKIRIAYDKSQGIQYLMRYNNFPLGYVVVDVEESLESYLTALTEKGAVITAKKSFDFKGAKGYDIDFIITDQFNGRAKIYLRGNRVYLLIATSLEKDTPLKQVSNLFFDSFDFIAFEKPNFQPLKIANENFTILFPKDHKENKTNYDQPTTYIDNEIYQGVDSNSGDAYLISSYKMGPYYKSVDLQKAIDEEFDEFKDDNDSLLYERKIDLPSFKGKEMRFKNARSNMYKNIRVVYGNGHIISILAATENTKSQDDIPTLCFNSLKPLKSSDFDYQKDKAPLIFNDLKSKDSLIYQQALIGLENYEFTKKDTKQLLKLIGKKQPDDSLVTGLRNRAIYSISRLKDNSTLPALSKLYHNNKTNDLLRMSILEYIPNYETDAAANLQFELLASKVPDDDNAYYSLFTYESDSLFSIRKYGDKIAKLLDNPKLKDRALSQLARNVVKDSLSYTYLVHYKGKIVNLFKKDIAFHIDTTLVRSVDFNEYNFSEYITLLTSLKTVDPDVLAITTQLANSTKGNPYIRHGAFTYYMTYQQDLDPAYVQQYMQPLIFRFEAMELLIAANKSDLIPQAHLEPQSFTDLSLYFKLYDYEGEFFTYQYIKDITHDGATYAVYTYTLTYDTEEDTDNEQYIALVEKGTVDITALMLFDTITSYETIDLDNLTKQVAEILKNREQYDY